MVELGWKLKVKMEGSKREKFGGEWGKKWKEKREDFCFFYFY